MPQTTDEMDEADRYRLIIDSISDYAIYMLDPDGNVASWNPGAERFKGYRADEIIGQHFSRFYTPEDRATGLPQRALNTAVIAGRFENEGWRVRKDGSRFWAQVVIDPILVDGRVAGFAKVTRDLTERRQAELEMRANERRFRHLVQGVSDYAIYMLDPGGIVTNWNTGAERIKGYRPDEIVGKHFSLFYTQEDRDLGEPERGLEAARVSGRYEKEGLRVRKDGTQFWANVVIEPVHDDDDALIGYAKVTRDITDRRAVEEKLARTNEELLQSQKMEAIGRLTGGVAHDFNNLLSAIAGSLELLSKRIASDDERSHRLIDNALQGVQRGASLTQRMLAFARRQELKAAATDVKTLVDGMVDLLGRSLGPDIELKTDFPQTLSPILIDSNQLELAIINLAVNAKDAMPTGGRLVIAGREQDVGENGALPAGRYVLLSIADTGEGMDEATLSRATEPFFTTKGVGKGTGLGLPMVRGLSEQSGGTVTLESTLGKGTTVTMWIPVSAASVEVAAPEVPAALEPVAARRLKVLVVDDDFLVAMNTTAMLEDLGHEVVEVHSGRDALGELSKAGRFDLLITDQAMPQMTGLQLIEAARKVDPDMPVVLATGYAELPAGADADLLRLGKPFFQSDLERVLTQVARG